MKTIACVLKTGVFRNRHMKVVYTPDHVRWLRDQVAEFVQIPHRFVCFSNIHVQGVDVIPLRDDLPGWWSKLEMFRELEQAFYLDLDTVLTRDITPMIQYPHQFTVLRNLSSTDRSRIGSGVMAWRGDLSHLYHEFMRAPQQYMDECTVPECWGDQGFIQKTQSRYTGWHYFQNLWPGWIRSYKIDFMRTGVMVPADDCRIVCFHGEPRPWQTDHYWVPDLIKTE